MLELLLGELKRTWIQFIRYPAEVIGGIIIITSVFYGLFLSAQYMAGPSLGFGDRLDAVVVGYVLWSLVLYIVNDIAIGLQVETQTGTLEQVFLSPFGAPQVFFARALASLALRLTLILGILLILMGITGSRLQFPPTLLLPLVTLLLAAYGLAFVMGACALIFKRVQQVLGVFQFALLFLIAAPTEEWSGTARWLAYGLPMLPSTGLLRDLMARGAALDWGVWGVAIANGLIYFFLGISLFRWAEREAKRRGILGGY
ncbi:ABC transporter permease [Pseudanabaena sp. FACHB-2040]|uniref:ABC transporter permease n=1 Tax=Pseudanabaena sp. FACHB-2040 TaxID=2692859 RepID=UPI001682E641|nr:ABC transporter permease [Pseudanabaena sp. FACHB-2040]MBD2256766.1 ABC transporter permease [Pseudanabaena sp. FACHB-2040]